MGTVVLYSNGNQECERAKMLLEAVHEDTKEFLLDTDFSDKQFRAEFGNEAEYPQVNVGFKHIGGLKETLNYLKNEKIIK